MSIFPTFTGRDASAPRIRFIIVNDRMPRQAAICATCGRDISSGYVRASQRRLLYCRSECVTEDAIAEMISVKSRNRNVS